MILKSYCLVPSRLSESRRHGDEHTPNRPLKSRGPVSLYQLDQIELIDGVVGLEIYFETHFPSAGMGLDHAVHVGDVIDPRGTERYGPLDGPRAALPNGIAKGLSTVRGLPRKSHRIVASPKPRTAAKTV